MGVNVEERGGTQRTDRDSSIPLLSTKLAVPTPRGSLVSRPRLTDRLDHKSTHCLTLVVAPAGWGKSSVISEWCKASRTAADDSPSVAWVSLDAGDNDPARFLLYVAAALDSVQPGLGASAHTLLRSPQPTPMEMVLTLLLNELSACDRTLTLVLDDYHLIESLGVHNVLIFLLDHLPPNLRLIIATRLDPPLPLSRLRVRGQLLELRAGDLRFTCEETAAFLNEIMGLNLTTEAVARLEARTEGWVAGLQLAALSLQGRTNPSEFLDSFTGSNRYIVDYLFEEVLSRQSAEMQTFLQETSFLSRLCGPLCEAVTGRAGGQALLEQLDSANLFLIPLDEERRWYRYHHLFADVLQARLAQQGSNRVAELHKRAAAWFDAQGLGEEAIHQALAGHHLEQAAEYVDRYADGTWKRGEQVTLEGWLRALPRELILARPRLCVMQGAIYIYTVQLQAVQELIDVCRPTELSEDPDLRDVQGRLLALEGFLLRMLGQYPEARKISQIALSCLDEENARWRAVTTLNLGVLYFEDGNLSGTIEAFTEAAHLARLGEDLVTVLIARCGLAESREEQGALQEASRLYQSALDYMTERNIKRFPHQLWLYCGLGRLHYEWNDLSEADLLLQQGLGHNLPGFLNACYLERLKVKTAQGDVEGAAHLFDQMKAQTFHPGVFSLKDLVAVAEAQTLPERDERVTAWMEDFESRTEDRRPFTFPYVPYREKETLFWARARLARGQSEPVQERLEALLEDLTQQGRHGRAVEVRALLASIHQLEERPEQAVTLLAPALILAAKEGYTRAFLDAGRSLIPVLRQAAAQGIEPECVARLLEVFRAEGMLQADREESRDSPLTEPLSERELEVLRLVAAGLSNPEIADHLFLSVGTIKRHVYNIYGKLDVTGRVEAATRARELKLL